MPKTLPIIHRRLYKQLTVEDVVGIATLMLADGDVSLDVPEEAEAAPFQEEQML
jgi:hypothetical protein